MSSVKGRFRSVGQEHLEGDLVEESSPLFGLVWTNPDRVGGAPCFFGTRVPVRILFDYVCDGAPIEEFVTNYPPISREEAEEVLRLAESRLLSRDRAA
ncbi:MAG: DUF433 domain-containing protein [Phycisphaerales bacterium]|nr:DUF433 domain-containing protein [Phycisphaerales bacterium]MCB9840619.1 DUF433 domain-containing protein [Phycisphaeraceae bacterium]